jgi:hypothetical protein
MKQLAVPLAACPWHGMAAGLRHVAAILCRLDEVLFVLVLHCQVSIVETPALGLYLAQAAN